MLTRSKTTVLMSVALVSLLCCSKNVFAQGNTNQPVAVTLGNIDANTAKHTTMSAILAQPKLMASGNDFIVSYTATYVADETGAGGKVTKVHLGPVNVKGAALSDEIKNFMKKHEHSKGTLTIDKIQVMGGGRVTSGTPVTLKYGA